VYISLAKNDSKRVPISEKQIKPELQPNINKQKNNEWVETKARAGNFGTPVFFKDEFESSYAEASEDRPEATESKSEENLEKKEKEQVSVTQKENVTITSTPETTSLTRESETKSVPQKKISQSKTFSQAPKPLTAPKPPLTLAQLSQGFLNHVKNEGNHSIHMLGKKNGRPSDEQIKYERYLQKLSWCLQNSFNIHNDRFPVSAAMNDTAQILLSLNKDGSMKHCHVSKTSGNRDLDYFITFIFNDASTSFPPVPQYLPHDPFTINYIIMVSASEENRWKLYRQ
jgi:hypothetical protein